MRQRVRQVARMTLGGAVCGGLLGIPVGAVFGIVLGLWCGHVSWGLDGAVFGLPTLGVAGALIGSWLGLTADDRMLGLAEDIRVRSAGEAHSPSPGR